jgi:hypothetical protein
VSVQGITCRSSIVLNTTDSASSLRSVAADVLIGTVSGADAGADSQNVTGAAAGVGGSSRSPISSRNFT